MAFQAFRNCEYNTQLYNSVNESCKDENPTILRIDLASLGYIIAFALATSQSITLRSVDAS